ncbi:hypothetical protein F4810DRAFT_723162 [Camillea tinctor]|nr:hypothetical protein F4810DRAFT_723162 [Camillea tinctor]
MYRTLKPGGTAVAASWLQIPQGECAQETRRVVWGPDARLALEPKPEHKDRGYIKSLLVGGDLSPSMLSFARSQRFYRSKTLMSLPAPSGAPSYKELLAKKNGFHVGEDGKITLEAIAQIAIVRKAD